MNNKQYIGRRVSRYEGYGSTRAVDGIALVVDEEHEYRAGNMDGYVMEITCPYGTQAMADALLRQIGGKSYTAYGAENAVMDPEAELGDGVTINGTYTMLANRQMIFGSGHLGQIGAPADSEIDHEYGVSDTYDRRVERKLAQTRSYIDKTADDIRIGVEENINGVKGTVAEIEVSVGKISGRVESAEGDITSLEATTKGLTSSVSDQEGRLSKVEQTASGLTSTVQGLDDRMSTIEQTGSDITLSVSGSLGGTAYIRLSNGSSGSIDMSQVRQAVADDDTDITITGGSMHFYNKTFMVDSDNLTVAADGSITTKHMYATYARLVGNGSAYDPVDPYDIAALVTGNIYLADYDDNSSNGIFGSSKGGNIELIYASTNYNNGIPSAVLGYVPAGENFGARINGTVISTQSPIVPSSDRDIKKDVTDLPERYIKMLDGMRPVAYRYTWQKDGEPVHWGYIAQEMEAAVARAGMTRADVAALVGRDGTGQMGIGYTELIPLLHMKIRRLEQRLERLEAGT